MQDVYIMFMFYLIVYNSYSKLKKRLVANIKKVLCILFERPNKVIFQLRIYCSVYLFYRKSVALNGIAMRRFPFIFRCRSPRFR